MSKNPETFSPVMSRAFIILKTLHENNGHHESIGQRAVEYKTLRHGLFEAQAAGLYYDLHPADLEKDIDRYHEVLDIKDVQLGYLLHDSLGKPWTNKDAHIWYTNANVTPEELYNIRYHHRIGHERLDGRRDVTEPDIALLHHEKLDGSGPEGKTAEELPHVVQVATLIDQIISRCQPSPYWPGRFNIKSATEAVYKGRGTEYNPDVLDNLKEMFIANTHMGLPSLRWLGKFE